MNKIICLVLLVSCVYLPHLHAQEMAGQGWTPSESRQRASGTVSLAVTGSGHNSVRPSSENVMPKVDPNENEEARLLPFPVSMPKAIPYPRQAIRRGWEGQTVVAAEVLPDGSVGQTALAKSSGREVLDKAAQDAIKTWKFSTESENDPVVPQYVDIPVTFKLEDR